MSEVRLMKTTFINKLKLVNPVCLFVFFFREAESVMVENLELHDGQEGISAFLQKRKPTWTHTTDCH